MVLERITVVQIVKKFCAFFRNPKKHFRSHKRRLLPCALSVLFPTRRYWQDNIKLDLKDAVRKGGTGSFFFRVRTIDGLL